MDPPAYEGAPQLQVGEVTPRAEPAPAPANNRQAVEQFRNAAQNTAAQAAQERLAGLVGVMNQMRDAATRAESGNFSTCERAYASMDAAILAITNYETQLDREIPKPNLLNKVEFVEGCDALPAPIQNCLRFTVAIDERAECEAAVEALSDSDAANYRRLRGL